MDIKIEKKPWYIRYRYYMIAALTFIIFLIYVISLSLGPRKLRIETDNIQIAEDRKSTRLNSSHSAKSRMPSSA